MSTFPQKCDDQGTDNLYQIMQLLTQNEHDLTVVLNYLVTMVNGGIQSNQLDIMHVEKGVNSVIRKCCNLSKVDLQVIADKILEDITHSIAESQVSINAVNSVSNNSNQSSVTNQNTLISSSIGGNTYEPPSDTTEQETPEKPQDIPQTIPYVEPGEPGVSPTVSIQGAGQHTVNIINHDGTGINAITIVINVLPSPVQANAQAISGGAAVGQSPVGVVDINNILGIPIGELWDAWHRERDRITGGSTTLPPFNPTMFGDTGEEFNPEEEQEPDYEEPVFEWPVIPIPEI